MRPLTQQDVESELSYAYLHAVASAASVGCKVGSRADDGNGIDALLTGWGPFANPKAIRTEVDIKIQLKATINLDSHSNGTHWSYFFSGTSQYDDLRSPTVSTARILVILRLPKNQNEWLQCEDQSLLLSHAAYWVSLRGAPSTTNTTGVTVYIPKRQIFSMDGLGALLGRLASNDVPLYEAL